MVIYIAITKSGNDHKPPAKNHQTTRNHQQTNTNYQETTTNYDKTNDHKWPHMHNKAKSWHFLVNKKNRLSFSKKKLFFFLDFM